MDASTARHVGLHLEQIADPLLQGDQFDDAEAGVVEIEEQIDVAGWTPFAA